MLHDQTREGQTRKGVPPRLANPSTMIAFGAVFTCLILYLYKIGQNPAAVFCDEALLGLRALSQIHGDSQLFAGGLFTDHYGTIAGALPVWTNLPFVWLFGLGATSIRLTSVACTLITAFVAWRTLIWFRAPSPWFGTLIFLGSPLVVHMARINFGHAPSILMIMTGWYYVARSTRHSGLIWPILTGFVWGLAAYGYPGFYVYVPLMVGLYTVVQVWFRGDQRMAIGNALVTAGTAMATYLPIVYQATHDDAFFQRLRLKNTGESPRFSLDTFSSMLQNYPKYFHWDYLFVRGELGEPGAVIQRHSIAESGLLLWAFLPLAVVCVISLIRRQFQYPWAIPAVLMLFLAPVPDLLTTTLSQPPYSFALAMSVWAIPFVACAGIGELNHLFRRFSVAFGAVTKESVANWLATIALLQMLILGVALYPAYLNTSAGFWGWQWGMEPISSWWLTNHDRYERLLVEPGFNQPETLLAFYMQRPDLESSVSFAETAPTDQLPSGTVIAITDQTRAEEFVSVGWVQLDEFTYPGGTNAWYILKPPARVTPGG